MSKPPPSQRGTKSAVFSTESTETERLTTSHKTFFPFSTEVCLCLENEEVVLHKRHNAVQQVCRPRSI